MSPAPRVVRFLDQPVSLSNTTPEDIAKAAVDKNALNVYEL
jgi:hypothetical protein